MKKQISAERRETTALYSTFPTEAEIVGILLAFTYVCALERVCASAVCAFCLALLSKKNYTLTPSRQRQLKAVSYVLLGSISRLQVCQTCV